MAGRKPTFDLLKRSDGEYYFNLVAPNGETIATSEGYETEDGAKNGIRAVKEYAPEAEIDDKT